MNLKHFSKGIATISMFICLSLTLSNCQSSEQEISIQGAGATFPYPLYSKMFHEYYKAFNVKINYQSIGSGGGIRQLKNNTVDFGATDAFMKDAELAESDNPILHIPICLGAVSLSYNLPNVTDLQLTPTLVANIFLGAVTKWNDPSIQALNPNQTLPDLTIFPVYRSDGSGTTYIFTDYLSKVDQNWATQVGKGKSINWLTGIGGKGNAGVAGYVQQTPGSIGYLGHIYTLQNNMATAKIQNSSGNFIEPSIASVSEAANTTIADDTRVSITNTASANGYPISGFTWIILYQEQAFNDRSLKQAQATKSLVNWMIKEGQQFSAPLHYAPLTDTVVAQAQRIIDSITFEGKGL